MPIRINLLAEQQAADELRRKDPVKRSIWIAAVVLGVVLSWSASLQYKIITARNGAAALTKQWEEMEPAFNRVEDERKKISALRQKHSALDQYATNRFLWAGTLNALQQSLVDNVQLVRFKVDQAYSYVEGVAGRTNSAVTVPGRPGFAKERITVVLDAKDYSARVAEQVPKFKDTLASQPYFQGFLQKTNGVRLTSLSAPQTDLVSQGNLYVSFGLQLVYQEKERTLHE